MLVDIVALQGHRSRRLLSLEGCLALRSVGPLQGCRALKVLSLARCESLASVAPLAVLNNVGQLQELDVAFTDVAGLERLRGLHRIFNNPPHAIVEGMSEEEVRDLHDAHLREAREADEEERLEADALRIAALVVIARAHDEQEKDFEAKELAEDDALATEDLLFDGTVSIRDDCDSVASCFHSVYESKQTADELDNVGMEDDEEGEEEEQDDEDEQGDDEQHEDEDMGDEGMGFRDEDAWLVD